MAKSETMERENTNCVSCGGNFPSSDALQTHGMVAHPDTPNEAPRDSTPREMSESPGKLQPEPNRQGSGMDQPRMDRDRGENEGMPQPRDSRPSSDGGPGGERDQASDREGQGMSGSVRAPMGKYDQKSPAPMDANHDPQSGETDHKKAGDGQRKENPDMAGDNK